MLLLAGCRLGLCAEFHQDLLLTKDQVLLVVYDDVVAGVFAEQDPVTHPYLERDAISLFNLAGPDSYYFALLRLFLGGVGNDDAALRGFFLFQPAYEDTVMQRSDVHGHFFDLRSIDLRKLEQTTLSRWATTDENPSGSSAAPLQDRRFPFADAQLLFAVPLVSRVSRLRQGPLQLRR